MTSRPQIGRRNPDPQELRSHLSHLYAVTDLVTDRFVTAMCNPFCRSVIGSGSGMPRTSILLLITMPLLRADVVSQMYEDQVKLVENDVLSLARAMPADRYDFIPTNGKFDDVRTFGEQIRHLATMIYMTAATVLQERSPYGPGRNNNGPDEIRTKAEVLKYLESSFAYARRAMASLNIKNHLDPVSTVFGSMPKSAVAAGVAYHSFNHYGQMVVYARMNGIVPPTSVPAAGAK